MVSFRMAKLIFVVVLGLISASEQCQTFCPEGWKGLNDRCFKFFTNRRTWARAESFCVAQGGNLASVHSAEEYQLLNDLSKAANPRDFPYWIGLTDSQKEGSWMWSDGSPVDYKPWRKGEPNGAGNEDCVGSYSDAKKLWNDAPCGRRYSSICVKSSLPAGAV